MASVRCGNSAKASSTPSARRCVAQSFLAALERLGGAALQFLGQFFVEAFDRSQFAHVDVGDFLQLAEAFGDQQLRQGFVDVELFLEHLRTLGEFLLALFRGFLPRS
jgi:hypothetical protein